MIKKIVLVTLSVALMITGLIHAQTSADVYQKLKREGLFEPYPISVEDFTVTGDSSSTEFRQLADEIAQIIRDDLSFHIAFKQIPIDSFLMQVLEIDHMTRKAWKFMGSDYLVSGEFSADDEDIKLRYSIWDLERMIEVTTEGFKTRRDNARPLAHSVADDVVRQVAGLKPLFNTRIAYVSARSGNKEIYMSDFDGHDEHQLTSNGSINLSPVIDPEGKSVLYTSFKHGTPELWKIDLEGGGHSKVATYKGLNSAAAISPDNDEICLTLSKDGNAELYLLDLAGNLKRRLTWTRSIESSPSYGPNSQWIAFSSDRTGSPQVYIMDREGLNVHRVTYNGNYNDSPNVSPDGTKLVFVTRVHRGGFDICVVDVTGENFRVITQRGANENPHWAPDSYHVIYSKRTGDKSDLYISDFMGINKRRITRDGASSNPFWGPYQR